jgi:putative peptidoglycan lipid II flippase
MLRIARVTALSGLARVPAFLVPVLMAALFGAGSDTDAYFLAYSALILVSLGTGLELAVVPFAAKALRSGPARAREIIASYAREAFWWGCGAVAAGGVLLLTGVAMARQQNVDFRFTLAMFLLLAPVAIATAVGGVYSGTLVSGWRLERVAVSNIFRGIGGLAGMAVATPLHQLWPIPLGLAAGEVGRMLWLKAFARRLSDAAAEGASAPTPTTFRKAAGYQASVQLLYAMPTLERLLIAAITGAISHIEYAYRIFTIATIGFDGGLAPWLLARWTNQHSDGELVANWRGVYRLVAMGGALALACGAGLSAFAPLIVRVLFQHGAFGPSDAEAVTTLLRWYLPAFICNMTSICLERLLLARGQNALFLRLGVLRAGVRLGTVLVLVPHLGAFALPAAMGAAEVVYLGASLFVTRASSQPVVESA